MAAPTESTAAQPVSRTIHSADGTALLLREWSADRPRALVRIVHGLGEHGGRYAHVAATLRDRGLSTASVDLRGHGGSAGTRGHARRFEDLLDDVDALARETPTDRPIFLLGHSLGGLVALRSVQSGRAGDLRGLILSAPALGLVRGASPFHRIGARLLRSAAPRLGLPNGIDPRDISRDPETVRAYQDDPQVHDRITPSLYLEMLRAMDIAAAGASDLRVPMLLLVPGADRIVRAESTLAFSSDVVSPVEIRRYPGYYHEPFNEIGRAAVLHDLGAWIEARLAA